MKQANADAYRKLEGLIEGRVIWGYEEGEFFRLVEITFSLTNVSNRVIENPEVRISHPEEPSRVLYGRYDTILEPGETQRFTLSEFPNSASKLFQAILHESGRGVKIALHAGIVDGDTISAFRTWEELQESLQSTAH